MSGQPICAIDYCEVKRWRLNGQYHREDGPAIEYPDGDQMWYRYNRLHRENGPAISFESIKCWYVDGIRIECENNEQFLRLMKLRVFW